MIKVVTPSSFDFDQPVMSLMDVHSRGVDQSWLRKSAAVLTEEMAELKPEKGISFVHLIALGDQEAYGCFAAGSKVANADGTHTAIEDVQLGSTVLSGDGNERTVVTTYERVAREAVTFRVEGIIDPVTVSMNHPFNVARCSQFQPGTVAPVCEKVLAKDVHDGDFLVFNTNVNVESKEDLTLEDCKFVGQWLADNRSQGERSVCRWENYFGNGYTNKRVPIWVLSLPLDKKAAIIRSYFFGDGAALISSKDDEAYATTASYDLAVGMQRLLWSVNIPASATVIRTGSYRVCFPLSSVPESLDLGYVGRPLKQTTKVRTFVKDGVAYLPVREVFFVDEPTPVFNLEVEEDHTYVGCGVYSFNCNRNGDAFPKSANEKFHHTFVKHAKWYHNHKNKPHLGHPDYGFVKLSAYNPEMRRVELVVGIDEKKDPDSIQKLASGEDIPVSMACITDPTYPVLTNKGYKPISSITTDDTVLTHTGEWRKVKQLNRRKYTGDLITFSVNGLPMPLEVTSDHMMFSKVFSGSREVAAMGAKARRYFKDSNAFDNEPAEWAHAEHVQVGDRFFYQPVTHRPGYAAIEDVSLARLLGYYTAEGSLQYNKDRACSVVFTCNMDDMAVRELPVIVSELSIGTSCTIRAKRNSSAALEIGVHSTGLAELVRRVNGVGCRGKSVPPEVFNASNDVKLAYVGAWHEGDGWADKKGLHWSTASSTLALECRDLLVAMGIPASIYKIDHEKCETSGHVGSGVEYTVNVSWCDAEPLVKWSHKVADSAYTVVCSERRRAPSMRKCLDGRYAYRVSDVQIRNATDVQTYNIEVEEDESYLLAGMISHNCRVPWDECTVCKNRASKAEDYCVHIREAVTKFAADGTQIGMVNYEPTFFDISKVRRNADRIAFSLRKVAGVEDVVLGTELARQYGIVEPEHLVKDAKTRDRIRLLSKLAEMEKEIEGHLVGDSSMKSVADAVQEVPDIDCSAIPERNLGGFLGALANVRVSLPLEDFLKLVMGDRFSELEDAIPSARTALPGVFSEAVENPTEFLNGVENYETIDTGIPNRVKRVVEDLARSSSLDAGPVGGRVQITILRKRANSRVKAPVTPVGKYLAQEYARYKFAFAERVQDPFVVKMALLQHFG